jgi:hypothetical protein
MRMPVRASVRIAKTECSTIAATTPGDPLG